MFDLNELTAEPAPGEEFSPPFQMALFDRRVRMPLEWLVESMRAEAGEHVSVEDLRRFAADGWFPLADAVGGNGEPGVYLYTPSRLGCTCNSNDKATPLRNCGTSPSGRSG